eukprot:TRINITY_DN4949_c0_g1_i1.p1 TRINITY_DN4949_c0_g1~~TRINITY_DN4949_c0_g1_i1.p1  ORF type:complete len:243 (-),score=37.45 TRINITY_DN4949_c0_g1_i1:48-776(-)
MSNKLFELIQKYKYVDCSHVIREGMTKLPEGSELIRCPFRSYAEHGFKKQVWVMACDLGTHIDSPNHWHNAGRTVDQIKMEELVGPGVVIDVSSRINNTTNANYELSLDDVKDWETKHGNIPEKAIVCMKSGWSKYFGDEAKYQNFDLEKNHMNFPGFSLEAVKFLVNERHISAIGVDTFSTDPGSTKSYPVHNFMLIEKGKYQIENMNLESVPETGSVFVALPLNVKGAPEAETRVLAFIP